MKRLLVMAVVLSSMGLKAQSQEPPVKQDNAVGINTTEPRATLDVNGDARIQQLEECEGCKWVLVQDEHGVVQKLPISDFSISGSSVANQVGGTASFTTLSNVEKYIPSYDFGGTVKEQGKITPTGIDIKIPYTGATAGTVTEKEYKSKENPNLVLKIKGATITEPDGELEATIYSKDGELNLKQFTLEEVNTKNYEKVEGTFDFNVKGVTAHTTVILKALCGIPDKLYGKKTNGKLEHQFVYLPVKGPDGEWWLNNNLGANYADISKQTKNKIDITRQATHLGDHNAYGSLFQWGREANDGYELMTWEDSSWGYGTYQNKAWYSDGQLTKTDWNPCPDNYRLPTEQELSNLRSSVGGSNPNNQIIWSSSLKLTPANARDSATDPDMEDAGSHGYYWSSTSGANVKVKVLLLQDSGSRMSELNRSYGLSVRCLKK